MTAFTADRLHIQANDSGRAGAFAALDAKRAGWDTMNFAAVRLSAGRTFEIAIDASKAGMRALAFKDHWNVSANACYVVQRHIDHLVETGSWSTGWRSTAAAACATA